MILKRSKLIALFLIITVFLCDLINDDLMLVVEAAMLLVVVVVLKSKKVNHISKIALLLFGLFAVHGMMISLADGISFFPVLQQLVGIVFSYTFYNAMFQKSDIEEVFQLYLDASFVVSMIAIVQQIAFLLKIRFLYDYSWIGINTQLSNNGFRSTGIFCEPGQLTLILSLACYVACYSIIGKNKNVAHQYSLYKASVVILAIVLTFSLGGFVCLIISLFLVLGDQPNILKKSLFFVIGALLSMYLYNTIPAIQIRINDTIKVFNNTSDLLTVNASSNIWKNSFDTMVYTFKSTFGVGVGIGNYKYAFNHYLQNNNVSYYIMANQSDGYSLILRMITELGIFSIIPLGGMMLHIVKNRMYFKQSILLKGILCYFCIRLLTHGHYFNSGMWFFIELYFFEMKYWRYKNETTKAI